MDERRRAAWRALGIGPLWMPRDPGAFVTVPAGVDAPPAVEADVAADARAGATEAVPAHAGPAGAKASAETLTGDATQGEAVTATPLPPDALGAPLPEDFGRVTATAPAPPPEPAIAPLFPEQADATVSVPAFFAVPADAAGRARRFDELRDTVAGCPKCRLCESRTQTVFESGSRTARWMLVGEAPGAEEDARGEPFVGQAGRLLNAMLAAIGLDRERDVYIANVIKCRPPGNRNPQPDEVAACSPYLREQIALVRPALIVVAGRFAAHTLLGTEASIASLRGRLHRYELDGLSVPVVVTYHPAYLLRNPADKARSWVDLCMARAEWRRQEARAGEGG